MNTVCAELQDVKTLIATEEHTPLVKEALNRAVAMVKDGERRRSSKSLLCIFALSKPGKHIMQSIGQALEVSSKDLVKRQQIEHALTELQNNATAVEVNVGSVETALQTVIDCARSLSQPANILDARACLVQCNCFWVFENGSARMKTNKYEKASAFSECGPA